MSATTINTIVTLISIGCTIFTFFVAKRTKKVQESVVEKLNAINLTSYTITLNEILGEFCTMTVDSSWNVGKTNIQVMNRLNNHLAKWNSLRSIVADKSRRDSLDEKIKNLILNNDYTLWDTNMTRNTKNELLDISKILNEEADLSKMLI